MTSDPNTSVARQHALGRLLDYALAESQELELNDVAQFLERAAASLEKGSKESETKRSRKKLSGDAVVVDLAEFRKQERGMVRSPSQSTRT
jgi:hypothetical protein